MKHLDALRKLGLELPLQSCVQSNGSPPTLPPSWQATAILHPFSPPPADGPPPDTPFFELCVATVAFLEGEVLTAQIVGNSGRTWWYAISESGTELSTDQGATFNPVEMGWSLPTTQWMSNPRFFISAPLNWMGAQTVDWWTQPAPSTDPKATPATWFWFNNLESEGNQYPFRMMFGAPPPSPEQGDPTQLAFFQNFSFTYFPSFWATDNPPVGTWTPPEIPGFSMGNPEGLELVVWNTNFGMTTVMTPVDASSSPLPTYVLYHWASGAGYSQASDRAQNTTMSYQFNPGSGIRSQMALMFGHAPTGVPAPPHSGSSFIYTLNTDGTNACSPMPLAAEPPDWARIPAADGQIQAVASDNQTLCPGQNIAIISVLFPPTTEYPQGRYLWTWYSPFPGSDGTQARPVTFMESASTVAEGGTSLALADYFGYEQFPFPIPAGFFEIPPACLNAGKPKKKAKRAAAPSRGRSRRK